MNNFEKILEKYDLYRYYKIIKEKNPSNNKPYHNLYHLRCVTELCYIIGKSENLNYEKLKILMLSALFHDIGHHSNDDKKNIKETIIQFKKYNKESSALKNEVINNIKATQYPYVIPDNKLSVSQKIIRDADLLQFTKAKYIKQAVIGFHKEIGITDIKLALASERKFLSTHSDFYTKKATEIYKNKIKEKLKELNNFEKTIESKKNKHNNTKKVKQKKM